MHMQYFVRFYIFKKKIWLGTYIVTNDLLLLKPGPPLPFFMLI